MVKCTWVQFSCTKKGSYIAVIWSVWTPCQDSFALCYTFFVNLLCFSVKQSAECSFPQFLSLFADAWHCQGSGQLQLQPAGREDNILQTVRQQRAGRGRWVLPHHSFYSLTCLIPLLTPPHPPCLLRGEKRKQSQAFSFNFILRLCTSTALIQCH